jgi:hypothetical protein
MRFGNARRKPLQKIAPHECVSDELETEFVAAFEQIEQINRAVWQKAKGPKQRMLDTPYGRLDIQQREGFQVFRNGEPLVRFPRTTDKPALFLDERAAEAAAMLYSPDGWGAEYIEPNVRLFAWLASPQEQGFGQTKPIILEWPSSALTDDVTWTDLSEWVKPWGITTDLMEFCEGVRKGWQLPMPSWVRVGQGLYELKSPRGLLCVSRRFGWVVTRQGLPLCHTLSGKQFVCNTLEEAQTLAVYYARYADDYRGGFYFWRTAPGAVSALELARARRALQRVA